MEKTFNSLFYCINTIYFTTPFKIHLSFNNTKTIHSLKEKLEFPQISDNPKQRVFSQKLFQTHVFMNEALSFLPEIILIIHKPEIHFFLFYCFFNKEL